MSAQALRWAARALTATCWISLRKIYTGQVDQVMFGTLGHFGTSYFKWLVVCDDDVDIRDPFMRDWVMAWRVQPDKDVRIIPNSGAVELDPSVHPPEVVAKLSESVKKVLEQPDTKQRAATLGVEPRYLGPDALAALVRKDTEYWGSVIKSRHITAD